ncbi:MAG TPA: transposase family protein [Blastocatellia bacterium]
MKSWSWTRARRPSNGLKKQRRCYSGKKKRHTLKAQFVINRKTRQVIRTAHGREHDFRLFKRSRARFA